MIKKYINPSIKDLNTRVILKELYVYHLVLIVIIDRDFLFDDINKFLRNEEREISKKYIKKSDRNNYLLSHSIVNKIFCEIEEKKITDIQWDKNDYGKPAIRNTKNLKFNLSHTKDGLAIVLSRNDIGIDIEYLNNDFEYLYILESIFTDMEVKLIRTFKDFYTLWTIKEAYLKLMGIGLSQGMKCIEIESCGGLYAIKNNKDINIINMQIENYILSLCFNF